MRALALVIACVCAASLRAGEVLRSEVEYDDGRYIVEMAVRIGAPPARVRALLTDYANLPRLNVSIKESELLFSLSDSQHRVRVVTESCITFFCKKMVQVQDVEEIGEDLIVSKDVARQSDFIYAHARWKIEPAGSGTLLTYNTDLKPGFWVAPVIGPLLIKRKLRAEFLETVKGLEQLAEQSAP